MNEKWMKRGDVEHYLALLLRRVSHLDIERLLETKDQREITPIMKAINNFLRYEEDRESRNIDKLLNTRVKNLDSLS